MNVGFQRWAGFVVAAGLSFGGTLRAQVQITEFMATNTRTLLDQDREYSDWIELTNTGTNAVNLGGWFLTDSSSDLRMWTCPATNLNAGASLVVFASGKNRGVAGGQWHTNFKLSAAGEYLALVRPDGITIATEFAPAFPAQAADVSYGLFQGTNYFFVKPSPGATNSAGYLARVDDTKFSHDRGFYAEPFNLTISTVTPETQIRYTTNGSQPSATVGLTYQAPITISRTTVVRAIALRAGYVSSDIDTQTYLFVDDIIRQATNGVAPTGWPASWTPNVTDYGMDPDIVNDARYRDTIRDDLKSLPSFSLVTDLNSLFNSSSGIYANASGDEIAWERAASIELIQPDGTKGFQANCGVRIRGGFSRDSSNPKHSFRLFFRSDYGPSRLRFPLYGDQGSSWFEKIDLRTAQNYSWAFQGDSRCVFLRDQFGRDAQLAMGQPASRGKFYHLYINGLYWGLYNTDERPDAAFGASYFGGVEEDYDTIKVDPDLGYNVEATDGNTTAWRALWDAAVAGFGTDAAYQKVQGNNPDGTRNPAYQNLLDVPGLIDYMLIILYGGNLDSPISNFLGNTSPNNYFALRSRVGNAGFRFFVHDAEHTLLNVNEDRNGPYAAGDPAQGSNFSKSNPQYLWQRLQANAEFKVLVGDRVHKHLFNGGPLSVQGATAAFLVRSNEIRRAMVCESARWGDAKVNPPLNRDDHWLPAMNTVGGFLRDRTGVLLQQLRTRGLYPSVTAPSFSQFGGAISKGYALNISAPAGTIYYTLDGSDPRLRGGAVSPAARSYSGPVALSQSATVRARAVVAGNWSALVEAPFTVIQTFRDLLITEIMYHPPDDGLIDGDELEFLELKNVGAVELDLSGVHFSEGVAYTFTNGTRLAPGQFLVLASSATEFSARHPNVPLAGVYQGRLANSGERLTLVHAVGTPIFSVHFGDGIGWPTAADGLGFSLVPVDPNHVAEPDAASSWRASAQMGGSPGANDIAPGIPRVVVNEVLTHTDLPQLDSIELHNPGGDSADVSGWYLTDDRTQPTKYRLPAGSLIPPNGFLVVDESQFNTDPTGVAGFRLDSHGEQVYLFSADAVGALTGYSDGFAFSSAANGVSFGRMTNSVGEVQYPAQQRVTLGQPNSGPRFGPVVINEIRYFPLPGDEEFIELLNTGANPVPLYDPLYPTNRWRLSGLDFTFPPGTVLPAHGLLVVAGADPAAFRQHNLVPTNVMVLGPFAGALQNDGERVELQRPDAPDVDTNGVVFVPYITVDAVRYQAAGPWPAEAAGLGASLERRRADAYGDDPNNWRASGGAASPGLDNNGNRRPTLVMSDDMSQEAVSFPVAASVGVTAADDGLPLWPGHLSYVWSTVSGPAPVVFADLTQRQTTAWVPGTGVYVVRCTVSDGELQAEGTLTLTVQRPPASLVLIPQGSTWRYFDQGTDQGVAWRQLGFDDAGWAAGPAQLGYSTTSPEGDEATVLSYGPNINSKYITYYFRRTFNITDRQTVTSLLVRVLRDDGAVVYLNGVEVFRSNMPEGVITAATLAPTAVGGADETTTFYESSIDPALLVNGTNVLAVEIHQNSGSSTDISFDLELRGTAVAGADQPPKVNAGPDRLLPVPGVLTLEGAVQDDGLPVAPGAVTNGWSQVSGPAAVVFAQPQLYRTGASFPLPGVYVLRLAAGDGNARAADDVTITVGGATYDAWRHLHFSEGELGDNLISGDAADPDGDGQSNVAEYQSGTDPRDKQSVLHLEFSTLTGADRSWRLQLDALAGRSYRILHRVDPDQGVWVGVLDVPAAETNRVVVLPLSLDGGATPHYFRLMTPLPP